MDRILTPDTLPYWIVCLCLILGLVFPTTSLVISLVWAMIMGCLIVVGLFLNRRQLGLEWFKMIAMLTSLVAVGTLAPLAIRWWLPWLGDLLRVQS